MKKTLYLLLLNAFVMYAAEYNVSTFNDFLEKLKIMTNEDKIIFGNDIRTEINNRSEEPVELKGTIEGNGHTLHIESRPVILGGNTVLDNLNLSLKPVSKLDANTFGGKAPDAPELYMNGYDLTLKDVQTNFSENVNNQNDIKPIIIMGQGLDNKGEDRENKLTISGDKEIALTSILAGSFGKVKTTKSTIDIQNNKAKLKNEEIPVKLGSVNNNGEFLNHDPSQGAVEIKTNNRNIRNFEHNNVNKVSMEINNVEFPETGTKNLPTSLENLTLKGKSKYPVSNLTVNTLNLEENSTLHIEATSSPDTGKLDVANLIGNGKINTKDYASSANAYDDEETTTVKPSVNIRAITGNPKITGDIDTVNNLILPEGYEPTENGEIRRTEENAEQPPAPAPEDSENENDGDSPTTDSSDTSGNNSDSSSQPPQDPPVNNEDDDLQGDDPNAPQPSGEDSIPKNDSSSTQPQTPPVNNTDDEPTQGDDPNVTQPNGGDSTPPKNDTESEEPSNSGTTDSTTNNGSSGSEDDTTPKTDVPENNNGDSTTDNQGETVNSGNTDATNSTVTGDEDNTENNPSGTENNDESNDGKQETNEEKPKDNPQIEKPTEPKKEKIENIEIPLNGNTSRIVDNIIGDNYELMKTKRINGMWAVISGDTSNFNKEYKVKNSGVIVGYDQEFEKYAVGVGISHNKYDVKDTDKINAGNMTNAYVYGDYNVGSGKVEATLNVGKNESKLGNSILYGAKLGYEYPINISEKLEVIPAVEMRYLAVKEKSYNIPEKLLQVEGKTVDYLHGKVGTKLAYRDKNFETYIKYGLDFNFSNKEEIRNVKMEDKSYINKNKKVDSVVNELSLGTNYLFMDNLRIGLDYKLKKGRNIKGNTVNLLFEYIF